MTLRTAPRRVPSHLVNGASVALGVALIQGLVQLAAGHVAALAAASGAILASLADVPLPPARTVRRVLTAGLAGSAVVLLAAAAMSRPALLGAGVMLVAFASAMTLAWGARAGPLSFVGLLALVFGTAGPPPAGADAWLAHAGWTLAGALAYVGWATGTSALLQPAYRRLAVAAVLERLAALLAGRAQRLCMAAGRAAVAAGTVPASPATEPAFPMAEPATPAADPGGAAVDERPLREWIAGEAALDERLQAARDLLFPARESAAARRLTALLLVAIDLRDTLLPATLDQEALGADEAAMRLRDAQAAQLAALADALAALARSIRLGLPPPVPPPSVSDPAAALSAALLPADDPRAALNPVIVARLRHLADDVARMAAIAGGAPVHERLTREQLALFESVEGWPLAALRPHLRIASPVLRHALRSAAALGVAYLLGVSMPWAAHPSWLVLSVAVVLRGNLEQTLARRNARVAGTVAGCLVVLLLGRLELPALSAAVFVVAVGVAHGYVVVRYAVTAAAATVMALLQAHLAAPLDGFAVPERLADTVLGALLAWGASYVLPSWERRAMPRLTDRVTTSLARLARCALAWPVTPPQELELRLARREAYEALAGLAAAAQRTHAEPAGVRVSLAALAALLEQGHALLAQLAAVRLVLLRRAAELDPAALGPTLAATAAAIERALEPRAALPAVAAVAGSADFEPLPEGQGFALELWVERRLRLARAAAVRVARAAQRLRGPRAGD